MPTRRSVLGALGTGIAASVAGCRALPDDRLDGTGTNADGTGTNADGTGTNADGTPTVPAGWSTRRAMPRAQGDVGSAVLDGKLYAFGGIKSGQGLDAVARGFAYDPTDGPLGGWESVPAMPRALWGSTGVASENAIYSFGGAPAGGPYGNGQPPSDEIFKFVPGEGWTDLTETRGVRCPYPTWAMRGVFNPDDGLIYNVGGATYSASDGHGNAERVWTFDPASDEVATANLTEMRVGKRWPSVSLVEVDGSRALHVIGGVGLGPSDDNWRYDLAADEWTAMTRSPRQGMYATNNDPAIDGELVLTHGLFWVDDLTEENYALACHRYDPASDEWATEELATPTYPRGAGCADGVIDGTLYVAGGHYKHYSADGFHEAVPYVESYRPE